MTASLGFTQLWLNSVADPSDAMGFDCNGVEHDPVVNVTVRQGADGSFQPVIVPGHQKVAKVTLGFCSDAQTAWLKAHQGQLLCLRDPRGEKFFGIYADSTFTPALYGPYNGVPFTFTEFTYDDVQ